PDTPSLFDTTVGAPYAPRLDATGGTPPYSWSVTGLPSGITFDPTTGEVFGTATAATVATVGITVTDATSATFSTSLPLTVDGAITVAGTLSDFEVGVAGTQQVITGGSGTYNYTSISGMPAGLALARRGAPSGTPTT